MMILAAFILLAAFFASYILMPFFEKEFRRKKLDFGEDDTKEALAQRKEQTLEAIRDLEYDYKMNKIADRDYDQLKEKLSREAVEIMKKLDSLEKGSNPDAVAEQIRTRI